MQASSVTFFALNQRILASEAGLIGKARDFAIIAFGCQPSQPATRFPVTIIMQMAKDGFVAKKCAPFKILALKRKRSHSRTSVKCSTQIVEIAQPDKL